MPYEESRPVIADMDTMPPLVQKACEKLEAELRSHNGASLVLLAEFPYLVDEDKYILHVLLAPSASPEVKEALGALAIQCVVLGAKSITFCAEAWAVRVEGDDREERQKDLAPIIERSSREGVSFADVPELAPYLSETLNVLYHSREPRETIALTAEFTRDEDGKVDRVNPWRDESLNSPTDSHGTFTNIFSKAEDLGSVVRSLALVSSNENCLKQLAGVALTNQQEQTRTDLP